MRCLKVPTLLFERWASQQNALLANRFARAFLRLDKGFLKLPKMHAKVCSQLSGTSRQQRKSKTFTRTEGFPHPHTSKPLSNELDSRTVDKQRTSQGGSSPHDNNQLTDQQ
mmetsp:Transcript_51605/g.103498  ORF Transcript_51605/g.103498 Transcript_51605/m.103498 type:complete len:111 (-) Transcript_51605:42-374(-)